MTPWMTQPEPGPECHRATAPFWLPAGVVDVWRAHLDRVGAAPEEWLSTKERERASRFRVDRDRARWAAAHAVLRGVLARYLAVAPGTVALTIGEHDKPQLAGEHDAPWVRFNLTHSAELALVAVVRGGSIGIDVEVVEDREDLVEIAGRVLDRDVVLSLEQLAPRERAASFFPAWVRHEARVKCRGTGLTDAAESDDPVVVVDLNVGPGYCAALAATRPPERVRCWDWATP